MSTLTDSNKSGAAGLLAAFLAAAKGNAAIRKRTVYLTACLFAAAILVVLIATGVRPHWSGPLEGSVVDQQTGMPMEGVVVVAVWQPEIQLAAGRFTRDPIAVGEAVSDSKGHFQLKAWGPRLAEGAGGTAPRILLFKPGYEFQRRDHGADLNRIGMRKFEGKLDDYAVHLAALSSALEGAAGFIDGRCDWQSMPMMLRALDRQDTVFRVERVDRLAPLTLAASLRIAERFYLEKGCGSVNAMLLKGEK